MKRTVIYIIIIFFSLKSHSQIWMNLDKTSFFPKDEVCDTINIDKCYITINGVQISIDTNVSERIEQLFNIVRIMPLTKSNYYMLSVQHIDTLYLVYDSSMVNDSFVYLVDTIHSTNQYNILIENKENMDDDYKVGDSIHLRLRCYFNEINITNTHSKKESEDIPATTQTCDLCQTIILDGEKIKVWDCPLYITRLYRLE